MSSRRSTPPNPRQFVPRVEGLEDRTVPAGNVRVTVFDGTLYVAGDDQGNKIWIAGAGSDRATIRALDATTTINGQAGPISVGGIRHDLYVRLYGGDDQLLVTGMRNRGTLDVDTGDGNDILGVSDAGQRGATILHTGAGNDNVILNGSIFRKYLFLDTGAGDDSVTASRIGVINFGMLNPSGNDFFDNQNSTITRPVTVGTVTNGPAPAPDTTAPTATVTTTASARTNTNPIALTVSFDEDVTGFDAADLIVTNGTVASVTAQDARTYSVQVTPAGQGPITVTVDANGASDAAGNGNLASNTVVLTFDDVAPAITINTLSTNDTTPTLTGTVDDPTAIVRITVNNRTYTATVTGTTWSATVTDALADNTYPVAATATDTAGNIGTAASPTGLVLDATAPAAVSTFDLAAASDSGTVGDLRTDASTVTLTGTAPAGTIVRLYRIASGVSGIGTQIGEVTAAGNGTYSFTNVALNVGPNSLAVRAVDSFGNTSTALAQTFTRNTAPTVTSPIAPQTVGVGAPDLMFDLTTRFADAERVVRMTTTYPTGQTGAIDINLFASAAPATVANFLSYNYDGTVFHRLEPNFVLQGGGFTFNDSGTTTATAFPPITTSPPVVNEPNVSNTRGTIAMAKLGSDPNSATNQFFFNLGDNSGNLDAQNSGFTVFGQVMHGGQQVVDAIAGLSVFRSLNSPGAGAEASPFPIRSGADTTNFPANVNATDIAIVTTVRELAAVDRMGFVPTSSAPGVATASVNPMGQLTIHAVASGTTTITVTATDLDGSATQIQFTVTVP
ncbi:peptidylprolyl isomerase [Gemmata sp. G18]|uniref:Peptidylprolyl isomerase n=1 Tax=Gemmata palustris TaxID=2822762 RepID=A0ABS5BXP3_9BACT|nr:peptidylprolyl isomerase [Gemmata palustris]MBP3958167.1 peptidylprolyl isomerase [Gemmata palustris]